VDHHGEVAGLGEVVVPGSAEVTMKRYDRLVIGSFKITGIFVGTISVAVFVVATANFFFGDTEKFGASAVALSSVVLFFRGLV
jgi:hypothetical protein